MLYVIDNEQARTIRSFAPGGARAGFQYVNEFSGSIEPYRAMPLLAISNTLNANGLATSAPKFWGNSCFFNPTQTSQATGAKSSTPEISAQSGIDSPRLKEIQPNATLTAISSAELRARAWTPVCWVHFHKAAARTASHGR